jgi:putative oxidoreductase
LYALADAFIGHRYWTLPGGELVASTYSFYKNVSIAGGFLMLSAIGPGKYSIDRE